MAGHTVLHGPARGGSRRIPDRLRHAEGTLLRSRPDAEHGLAFLAAVRRTRLGPGVGGRPVAGAVPNEERFMGDGCAGAIGS